MYCLWYSSRYFSIAANESEFSHTHRKQLTFALKNFKQNDAVYCKYLSQFMNENIYYKKTLHLIAPFF